MATVIVTVDVPEVKYLSKKILTKERFSYKNLI